MFGFGISVGVGSRTVASGSVDSTAPTLSSPVGTKTGATTATIGATTDEANGAMYGVVSTSNSAPTATQVKNGLMHTGAAAAFAGTTGAIGSTGAKTINATGLTQGTTYYGHLMHEDAAGNKSTVSTSASFTTDAVDSTAPTLSSPVGTKTGSTTATIGATTDEANGVMYGVVSTSSTAPSAAQVKAGQMHTGSAAAFGGNTGSISSTGAKTISATGLTASTTYYAHLMHEDAATNQSTVSTSASFTTDASGSWQPSDSSASVVFIASTSSCFTDQAGTTPVSADGDTVQSIKDTAGNLIAFNTGGSYPLYRTNSGKPYLDCTGGRDLRAISNGTFYALTAANGSATCGIAVRPTSTNGENYLEAGNIWARTNSNGGSISCFINHSGGQTGDNAGVTTTANADYRSITKLTGGGSDTVEIIVNGTTNGANSIGANTLTAYTSQRVTFIGNGGNGCRIYRFAFFPSTLDSTNTTNLDTWLAAGM